MYMEAGSGEDNIDTEGSGGGGGFNMKGVVVMVSIWSL